MPQNNVTCNFIVASIFKNVKELNVFPAFLGCLIKWTRHISIIKDWMAQ